MTDPTRKHAKKGSTPKQLNVDVSEGWTGKGGYVARIAAAAGDVSPAMMVRRLIEEEARRVGVKAPAAKP